MDTIFFLIKLFSHMRSTEPFSELSYVWFDDSTLELFGLYISDREKT